MFLNSHQKSVIYTILSGALFGTIGFFGIKSYEKGLSVLELLGWRFSFASIVLLIVCWSSLRKFSLRQLSIPFGLGLFIYASSTYMWFESIKLIGSGLSMVIFYSFPVYIAILSWVIGKENITKMSIISIVIMMLGLILIADLKGASLNYKGLLLSLMSAILYGVYFFVSKKSCKDIDSTVSASMVCLGNAVSFIILMFIYNKANYNYDLNIWMFILLIAVIGTALPILFLFKGLENVSELEASILSVSEPIVSLFFGVVLLSETMGVAQIFGVILITIAAIMIQIKK